MGEAESRTDPIQLFELPPKHFAQEPRFVPREGGVDEDDGWLLFYVFDEAQLDPHSGEPAADAISELWILDARNMRDVVATVQLPQRVPYGLHGSWFSEVQIRRQREVEHFRDLNGLRRRMGESNARGGVGWKAWMRARAWMERAVG